MKTTMEREPLRWDFPLPRIHTGISLGNGVQGVLVWGDEVLSLTIARAGFWDHRGGTPFAERIDYARLRRLLEAGDEAAVRAAFAPQSSPGAPDRPYQLSGGRLDLRLPPGVRPQRAAFDHASGALTVTLGGATGETQLVVRQAMDAELCWIELPLGLPITVALTPQWDAVSADLAKVGIAPPRRWADAAAGGFHQTLPADPGLALVWRRRGDALVIATALGADPVPQAEALAASADLAAAATRSAAWWSAYWEDVPTIDLPDPELRWYHEHGLFKQAGLTTPGGIAATLQGPWMEECRLAPWSNDYHFNINLELIYWPALSSGRYAHLAPLWAMLRGMLPRLRANGAAFLSSPSALMLPHATDDRGTAIGAFWHGTIDHASTAWMALLAWLHWRYAGDREVLVEIAWPLLVGAFDGFWAMAEPVVAADGSPALSLPVSVSPEFGEGQSGTWGRDASFQLAAFHRVAAIMPLAAAELGQPLDPRWARVARELPPYSSAPVPLSPWDAPGTKPIRQITLWQGQELTDSHRHHSHLAGLWPFASLDWRDPAHARTIDHSLHVWATKGAGAWSAWCQPWAAVICARSGRTDAALCWLHWLIDTCANEGRTLGMGAPRGAGSEWAGAEWARRNGVHEYMQLDANLGIVTAIHELLVQCTARGIEILPAIPVRWKRLRFDGIHAEGGFVLGASVEGGRCVEVRVHSPRGGTLRLWPSLGERVTVDSVLQAEAVVTLMTAPGQRLVLRRG